MLCLSTEYMRSCYQKKKVKEFEHSQIKSRIVVKTTRIYLYVFVHKILKYEYSRRQFFVYGIYARKFLVDSTFWKLIFHCPSANNDSSMAIYIRTLILILFFSSKKFKSGEATANYSQNRNNKYRTRISEKWQVFSTYPVFKI